METMPLLFAEASKEEIIFVDYGCSEGSSAWVKEHYPKVKIVLANDDPGFCAARARNIGASIANSEWLFFIDGDIKVKPGFVKWIKSNAKKGYFYRASPLSDGELDRETWGSCLCSRNDYKSIGGYDEVFRGWGGEDTDLYSRLALIAVSEKFYPNSFVEAISHDNDLRFKEYALQERSHHLLINKTYSSIKLALMRAMNSSDAASNYRNKVQKQLEFSVRKNIMTSVTSKVELWIENPDSHLPYFNTKINIKLWLPDGYSLIQQCDITFSMIKNA